MISRADNMSSFYTADEARKRSDVTAVYNNAVDKLSLAIDQAIRSANTEAYINFFNGFNNKALCYLIVNLYELGYDVKLYYSEVPELHIYWRYEENGTPVIINNEDSKEDTELFAEIVDEEIKKREENK